MKHTHAIWILLVLTVACLAHAQAVVQEIFARENETTRRARLAGQNNDRSEMPFLEVTSLSVDTGITDRRCTGEAYAKLATAEECVAFLPKILPINVEPGYSSTWSSSIISLCLGKIEAAIATRELPEETLDSLIGKLVMYTQVGVTARATALDAFLIKHCAGYTTSWQRLVMFTRYVNGYKSFVVDIQSDPPYQTMKSLEAIPLLERVDLRGRFSDLPPLPEEMAAELEAVKAAEVEKRKVAEAEAAKVSTEETKMPPEDPPEPSSPYLWPAIAAVILVIIAAALILRKVRKGKK